MSHKHHHHEQQKPPDAPEAKEQPTVSIPIDDPAANLRAELEQAKDRALRLQAELDNYRKRASRELEDRLRYADMGILRDLLPVLDNIRLGGYLRKDLPDAEIESVLDGFPKLRERLHQRAGLLSGGEQQMLAIARGLMAKPRLLLLDEPSLGLAPNIIKDLFHALDLLRDARVTILLVDQMAGLALALADRAYVIEHGRIVASGSGAEIAADGALEKAYLGVQ